ncbi:hypothetical protein M3Y99_01762200 [Aphelenchoides fujianensis]|nr:hypothetical protein M3Y99_01762200 [Aphelenchoides fujianensis]
MAENLGAKFATSVGPPATPANDEPVHFRRLGLAAAHRPRRQKVRCDHHDPADGPRCGTGKWKRTPDLNRNSRPNAIGREGQRGRSGETPEKPPLVHGPDLFERD